MKRIKCSCPNCGKEHKVKMKWIGKGIPPKYCPGCKLKAEGFVAPMKNYKEV